MPYTPFDHQVGAKTLGSAVYQCSPDGGSRLWKPIKSSNGQWLDADEKPISDDVYIVYGCSPVQDSPFFAIGDSADRIIEAFGGGKTLIAPPEKL